MIDTATADQLAAHGIDPTADLDTIREELDYQLAEATARRGLGHTARIRGLQQLADALMTDDERADDDALVARLRADFAAR